MKQRIITAIIAGGGFLTVVAIGGWAFTLMMIVLATIALYELLKMKKLKLFSLTGIMSVLLMWLLLIPEQFFSLEKWLNINRLEIFLLFIVALLAFTVLSKNKFTFDDVGFIIISTVYIGFGFFYFIHTRFLDQGLTILLFILIIVWSTDSGAYFTGRAFGKNKLWPEISPKKTVEGALGGILSAVILGFIFTMFFPIFSSKLITGLFILTVSISGQLGDLVESALKRHYAVKDSGNVLPGHGGILDRFDSLIFVMPIIYLFQFL